MRSSLLPTFVKLGTGATARWLGCGPEGGVRVYFANHTSHLDTLVLWSVLPLALREVTRPVAACEYWDANGARRWLARGLFQAVCVKRSKFTPHENPLNAMLAALDEACSLILFPEGSRMAGPEAAPFKPGLYHLARLRPSVEFIPVYIANLNRMLPKGHLVPVPLLCSVNFGGPLSLEPHEAKETFLERARGAVNELRVL